MGEESVSKQKGKVGLIVALVLAIIVILCLVGYICYDKGIIFKSEVPSEGTTTSENEEQNKQESNTTVEGQPPQETTQAVECPPVSKPKCTGTYYGELIENNYNLRYTYILNEDGTFTADFGGVSGTRGVFVINDNTISLVGHKDTVGPRELDPYYDTEDYIIADDCSYIKVVGSPGVELILNKK